MNVTKETAYQKISELVTRFGEQYASYKDAGYNETLTRRDFIDPFFKALGWDVDNENGYAESYREVIHEDRVRIGKATKAPDYSFRLAGGKRLFFVEAKKPSVAVKEEILPAYQVRRYGWSAKLPISIITDFEEFAIYDCTKKPYPDDKASVARIKYLTYTDYLPQFDFVWDTFSKERVLKGSFDKFIAGNASKRGTTAVDNDFLQSLDNWRTELATSISRSNKNLDEDEINFVVQQTLDRIIFLRIAEDRSVEPYGNLKSTIVPLPKYKTEDGKTAYFYQNLLSVFRVAEDKYNSGLFDFDRDRVSKDVVIDNKVISTIINQLYYPESPYEFSVLSVEILGSAYEQFLGKTITIDKAHRAKIEEKPAVRKAGGVYYTPQYIVDYIVENTLGKLAPLTTAEGYKKTTPGAVAKLSIVDPACGSGSFLIGAYQYLLTWHIDYYTAHPQDAIKDKAFTPTGVLSTSIKKQILLNNIYGVDIDVNAVEVTKLSLLLKCMEGETEASINSQMRLFNERVLPSLDNNIKSGNSLVDTDYYDTQLDFGEEKKIKPFNWQRGFPQVYKQGSGFDVVIGNPPYDVLEKERLGESIPHLALQKYIQISPNYNDALGGKLNLYRFFMVKAIQLTKIEGRFGMIVPSSILGDKSCSKTREHLMLSTTELAIDCFPQKDNPSKRVFESAKLSTTIFTGAKQIFNQEPKQKLIIRTYPANSFEDEHKKCTILLKDLRSIDPENLPIPLIDNKNWKILRKVHKEKGIKHLAALQDFVVRRGEINQTIYKEFIEESAVGNQRLIKGVQIGQYRLNKKISQGKVEWLNEKKFLKKNIGKDIAKYERIATQRITGVDEKLRIVATIIEPKAYFADSTNSIYLTEGSDYDLKYLLGLLNSTLFQWRFKLTSTNNNVGTNELLALPIREIDFSNLSERNQHKEIVKYVTQLLTLNEEKQSIRLQSKLEQLNTRIAHCEDKINQLVYGLYNLSPEEIKVVTG